MFSFKPVKKDIIQKNRALLVCYTANSGNFVPTFLDNLPAHLKGQPFSSKIVLFWAITQRVVVIASRRFEKTAYRSHPQLRLSRNVGNKLPLFAA